MNSAYEGKQTDLNSIMFQIYITCTLCKSISKTFEFCAKYIFYTVKNGHIFTTYFDTL